MTLKLRTLAVAVMAMGGLLVGAGCSSLKVNVIRDPAITIPPGSTWAWGPPPAEKKPDELDPRVNNSIIHDRVQRAVERVLSQKGFRQTDPNSADFLVAYRVGVKDSRQVVTQAVPVGPAWGGWGWGYYGPPPMVTSREITYAEGALMIDMVQRSTGKLAFRSIGVDQDVTGADGSEPQIQKTVEKLLQELP
jgi:Domain of unknown function (DUF4136)